MENSYLETVSAIPRRTEYVNRYFQIRGVDKNDSVLSHTDASAVMFAPSYHHARELLQAATARGALRILEIGCGCGEDSILLSGEKNEVCAIDADEQRVATARKNISTAEKAAHISVYQMDAGSLEFADNSFDLIYANSFLLWVDREAVLSECRRVAKAGGIVLFVHESMKGNPIINLYRLAGFRKKRESLVDRPTAKELASVRAQFANFRAHYFYLISPLLYPLIQRAPAAWPLQRLCSIFQKIDAYLLRCLPWLDRFAWIGVLQYTK